MIPRHFPTLLHLPFHRLLFTSLIRVDDHLRFPWLFVGVGNPGLKFCGTRHNAMNEYPDITMVAGNKDMRAIAGRGLDRAEIGFEMIDALSKTEGIPLNTTRHNACVGEGTIKGVPVVLAKPQTYANLIGESVVQLVEYYGLPAQRMVVMFDDMETPLARLWLLPHGGHGNHKGLINLIAHLKGERNFPRLRIGIGSPSGEIDPKAYVLQKFCAEEREMMNKTIDRGCEVLRQIATMGIETAIRNTSRSRLSV